MDQYSSFIWYPLDAPPFLRGKFSPQYSVTFLNESNKILGWELEKPGVFCFDVTQRNNGWTKVEVPLENHRKPFIVRGCNPNIGEFHVMFTYEPDNQPLVVSAFFMSNNFDYFQPLMNKSIELPALCYEYLLSRCDEVESEVKHMMPSASTDFEFVNLGHQQVGLVLHKYFEDDPSQGRNTGIILVVTFEYDVIVGVNNTLEIHTRFLGTRRYRYRTKQLRRKTYNSTETCCKFHKKNFGGNYVRDIYSETRQVHLNAAFQL
jgi:hypothetical protein